MKHFFIILIIFSFVWGCNKSTENEVSQLEKELNNAAEKYVKLVLKTGHFDPDFVDAYYGPAEWKNFDTSGLTLNSLKLENDSLLNQLDHLSKLKTDSLLTARYTFLYKNLLALKAKLFMLDGGTLSFDEECKAVYDVTVNTQQEEYYAGLLKELDDLLPGTGDVNKQLDNFRNSFIIPKDKLAVVFQTAIEECKLRSSKYISLPDSENFTVEFVTDKPWSGYNWYKGNFFSVIQVNTDLPVYIDRAVDLAAHEGYPGHHVYNCLLESNLLDKKGWIEFSVYPLFSPQSLIAEGTANYGIDMVFPGADRIKYEKEVLFPLAGIDPEKSDLYYKILDLTQRLAHTSNNAARKYLNNEMSKEETKAYLIKFGLLTPEKAEHRIKFFDKYRSYIINYTVGLDLIADYIKKNGGDNNTELRWKLFEDILSTPKTPSGLTGE